MPGTLYLISKSPNQKKDLATVFSLITPEDIVCFIQDGVYFSNKKSIPEDLSKELAKVENGGAKIFYLKPDIDARALNFEGDTVDYDGLLDLIEKCDNVFH
jgi:sulfur relay protein TusB/DsrH